MSKVIVILPPLEIAQQIQGNGDTSIHGIGPDTWESFQTDTHIEVESEYGYYIYDRYSIPARIVDEYASMSILPPKVLARAKNLLNIC